VADIASHPMTDRLTRLAEVSIHGANVQEGQIVLVGAGIGLGEQARATAAAYRRGAKFIDVAYFDPYVKRVRIELVHPALPADEAYEQFWRELSLGNGFPFLVEDGDGGLQHERAAHRLHDRLG
jgi:hypothetical protein